MVFSKACVSFSVFFLRMMRIMLIYHSFIPVCMGSGSGMKNPLASIHWSFSLKVRDDWGFQVNPLCRHDITSLFPPSGNEGYVCNRDVTCAHQSLSLFWISCDCFGTFMQLIIRVLSLRSRVPFQSVTPSHVGWPTNWDLARETYPLRV